MVRYSIAALVGVLYIVAAAFVVQSQGNAYRDGLRRSKVASQPATPEPAPVQKEAEPTSKPPPEPTPVIAANVSERPAPVRKEEPKPEPAAPAHPEPPATAESAKPNNPPAAALDPFWSSPEVKEVWDLSHVTIEDEMRLGRQLHALILQHTPAAPGAFMRRVKEAAAPLLDARARKDIKYEFTVLDSEVVFALSHPGGYVYVSRALLDMIGQEEDYALQFALAHEIAHVDLQHALQCLSDPGFKDAKVGTMQAYYSFVAPMGYQDAQEFEADAWALKAMRKLDHSRYESLSFLRKFKTYAEEHGFEDGKQAPVPPRGVQAKADQTDPAGLRTGRADLIENHYRAHPAAWERLQKLEALWPTGKKD